MSLGKPVAITEFGCATYRGVTTRGASAGFIVVWDETATPVGLGCDNVRDEEEQATPLLALFALFDAVGVDFAFVFTFASSMLPHRDDPCAGLDLDSCGLVWVPEGRCSDTYPGLAWEPKLAFKALGGYYRVNWGIGSRRLSGASRGVLGGYDCRRLAAR